MMKSHVEVEFWNEVWNIPLRLNRRNRETIILKT